MDNVNILLVDDQPGKLLTAQAILADLGCNIVTASSGREALQHLLKQEFALVLLDVVMPDMDGFDTATLIRQRPRLEFTPIIFVTAYSTSDLDRLRGYELGAVDYVFAPIVPEILQAKVSVFVELYRKRRELAKLNEQLRNEIVEKKKAQEQALQAERLAAIGQMVAGLAHESRNALQQIQAATEMLARRVKGDESALVAGIQRAHDRMHMLLEDVRGYAAPLKLGLEVHDLSKLWREAWDETAPARNGRKATLREFTNEIDLRCLVDPFPIERVFRNIIENTIAAKPDAIEIEVRCSEVPVGDDEGVLLAFADNGPGLSEEQRRRIFEPFFTTKTRGTGLGMAIAKRIVEAHGGRISVGDPPPVGTIIEVLLPRGRS